MAQDSRFTVSSAFAAAADNQLAKWVGDFLASRGSGNATLAAGLAQREHWWLGPLWLPLDRLVPLAHRYEALTRAGASRAWVLLWFDDEADHRNFRDRVLAFVT